MTTQEVIIDLLKYRSLEWIAVEMGKTKETIYRWKMKENGKVSKGDKMLLESLLRAEQEIYKNVIK